MSASEMSSPKVRSEEVSVKPKITKATVGDWPASSDNPSDPIATIPTCQSAINVPVTKPAIAADTYSAPTEECRRTRSKPEPRGRRTLTCTTCRFTCSNTQEFTQHQNTAHTASTNHDVPARRFSTRQKRISSNTENDTKNHSKTTLKKSEANETQKNQSLGVKNHSPPPRNSDSAVANCGDSINKIENCETSGPGAENCDQLDTDTSRQDLKPAADIENAESGKIQSPTSDSSQLDTATMLSTNGPVPQDLGSMSGTSEDENDKSEEGGRLVIDDSSISGSNSSIATPTRCGNIQNRTYICKYCDFTTNSAQQSLYHKKQEHACTLRIYSCNLCDYATEYKQKLPRHHRLHFQGTLPIDDANQVESMEAQSISSPVAPLASAPTTSSGTISASYSTPTSSTPPLSMGSKRSAEEAELDVPQYVQPEDGDEEDGDDDELGESDTAPAEGVEDEEQSLAAAVMPPLKKKRKDVSPDKYFEDLHNVSQGPQQCQPTVVLERASAVSANCCVGKGLCSVSQLLCWKGPLQCQPTVVLERTSAVSANCCVGKGLCSVSQLLCWRGKDLYTIGKLLLWEGS